MFRYKKNWASPPDTTSRLLRYGEKSMFVIIAVVGVVFVLSIVLMATSRRD